MIYLNEKELQSLHIGDKEIQRVLFGDKLVWENNKIVNLGYGQSFDLSSIWHKYGELTANNIFYLDLVTVSVSASVNAPGYLSVMGWLHKTYDNSTGLLETDHYAWGSSHNETNVNPVLVTDLSKIEYIGTAKTFNIKNLYPDDYQNFTANNFLLKIDASLEWLLNDYRASGSYSATVTHSLEKSYDPLTGILTCQIRNQSTGSAIFNYTYATSVYLVRKTL